MFRVLYTKVALDAGISKLSAEMHWNEQFRYVLQKLRMGDMLYRFECFLQGDHRCANAVTFTCRRRICLPMPCVENGFYILPPVLLIELRSGLDPKVLYIREVTYHIGGDGYHHSCEFWAHSQIYVHWKPDVVVSMRPPGH